MPRHGLELEQPARGTVAQVLAQARASLKEPSRPFTPAEPRPGTTSSDQLRPSSAFGEENYAIFGMEKNLRKSRKGPRSALSRGMPAASPDSPVAPARDHTSNIQRRDQPAAVMATAPAWVREMDELIESLDAEMGDLGSAGSVSNVERILARARVVLGALWPCVEAMAAACNDGDERWVLQRNRLFATLFRVLERREADLRLAAARCVLRLLSAGRASRAASLQLPKYEAAVCKVLFQLTKASRNDDAFFDAGAVQPMLSLLEAQSTQLNGGGGGSSGGGLLKRQDSGKGAALAQVALPADAPVYLAGALKNISATEGAQQRLGQLGAVSVLCTLMRGASDAMRDSGGGEGAPESSSGGGGTQGGGGVTAKQQVQLLTYVTGALRNLSLSKAHHRQMSACGAPALLCSLVAGSLFHEGELMFNVARVLAKISLHDTLRQGINSSGNNHLASLLALMEHTARTALPPLHSIAGQQQQQQQQGIALMVRVAFTLGNLTASNEKNRRHCLCAVPPSLPSSSLAAPAGGNGGPVLLVDLLEQCHASYERATAGQHATTTSGGSEDEKSSAEDDAKPDPMASELEELLVKLVRLVANLSISTQVGPVLVALPGIAVLVSLLESQSGRDKERQREELLLNAVSAITNLSFYPGVAQPSVQSPPRHAAEEKEGKEDDDQQNQNPNQNHIFSAHERVCGSLVNVLLHDNEEAVAEAARAFGNFSRDAEVRRFMCAAKADEVLVILLDHSSRDVVLATAGALVNMGADPLCSHALTEPPASAASTQTSTGCSKLLFLLRRAGLRDVGISAIACKALFNVLAALVQRSRNKHRSKGTDGKKGNSEEEEVMSALEGALGSSRPSVRLLHSTLEELLDVHDGKEQKENDDGGDDDGGFRMAAGALLRLLDRPLKGCNASVERSEPARRRVTVSAGASAYEELAPPLASAAPTTEQEHKE